MVADPDADANRIVWPGRLRPDPSLRRLDDGRVLVGGSPLTVLRFARPVDVAHVTAPAVIGRLIDTGMAHPDPPAGPFTADDVTVVIPVFGHVDALSATLAALARMPVRCARIIVVDDASPDHDAIAATVALAGRRSTKLIRRATNGGAAAARNTGAAEVTTSLVAFVDAGCVPEPDWLTRLLPQFADPQVALVAPRLRADPDRWSDSQPGSVAPQPSGRRRDRLRSEWAARIRRAIAHYEVSRSSLDLGDQPARIAPGTRVAYVPSACIVVRTAELHRVDGFDASLRVGEDVDLVWRLARERRLRYEPTATAAHDIRTAPRGWLRRRFDYGTSAAPLSARHPGGPVPVRVSGWSAAAWAAVAFGRPVAGTAIAAASTVLLTRKLTSLDHPVRLAGRLAGLGNLAAGGLLANAARRAWWPVAVPLVLAGPRPLRRAVVAAFVVPPLLDWRRNTGLDPVTWLVLCTADDLAYGAGVWAGCVQERTVAPLLPDFSAGRLPRSTNPSVG